MSEERTTLPGLIEEVRQQVEDQRFISADLEERILAFASHANQEDPNFAHDFIVLFHKYMTILGASAQDVEAHSTGEVHQAFMISAVLVEAGLKAQVYKESQDMVLAHYLQALQVHQYVQYFIDSAVDQAGSMNPIWNVILNHLTA